MNYSRTALGPIYRTIGVPATLTVDGVDYPAIGAPPLKVLDKTSGVALGGPIEVETIRPAATVRVNDLLNLGLDIDRLDRQFLLMNGSNFLITSSKPMPSPNGKLDGEIYLFLEAR